MIASVPDSRLPLTAGSFLICLDRPWHHIRHHLAWAPRIADRVKELRSLTAADNHDLAAACIVGANVEQIRWSIVRVWRGATKKEWRRMVAMKESSRLCPKCKRARNREHDAAKIWKRKRLKEITHGQTG